MVEAKHCSGIFLHSIRGALSEEYYEAGLWIQQNIYRCQNGEMRDYTRFDDDYSVPRKSPSFSVDYSSRVSKNRERISMRVQKNLMLTVFTQQI